MKERLRGEYLYATSSQAREELERKLKEIKDEQRKKFDLLYQDYEESVQTMLEHQNVRVKFFYIDH